MKIGISLSGGGVRGIAHIGVLQALNEGGIFPTHIAGVSAGAVVGALYAQGITPTQILEMVRKLRLRQIIKPAGWGKMGLFSLEKMTDILLQHIPHDSFEGLQLPFSLSATDVGKGESVLFQQGELIRPLLASCSVPFLFAPTQASGRTLLDGGLLNGLLYEPIADCDIKIGVHVNAYDPQSPLKSLKGVLQRCFNLVVHHAARQNLSKFDFALEPTELGYYSATNLRKAQELYDIGYKATKNILPALQEKL